MPNYTLIRLRQKDEVFVTIFYLYTFYLSCTIIIYNDLVRKNMYIYSCIINVHCQKIYLYKYIFEKIREK